jgi:hypothetical protein
MKITTATYKAPSPPATTKTKNSPSPPNSKKATPRPSNRRPQRESDPARRANRPGSLAPHPRTRAQPLPTSQKDRRSP